jgi:hypothetical protein
MKRVYVAGAYNADNIVSALENMRKGMRVSTEVFLAGFAPFVPWFDYHFNLMLREGEKLTIEDYYEYSIAWLKVSDAMVLVPGYENSKGTKKEIEIAKELGIPIYYTVESMAHEETMKDIPLA